MPKNGTLSVPGGQYKSARSEGAFDRIAVYGVTSEVGSAKISLMPVGKDHRLCNASIRVMMDGSALVALAREVYEMAADHVSEDREIMRMEGPDGGEDVAVAAKDGMLCFRGRRSGKSLMMELGPDGGFAMRLISALRVLVRPSPRMAGGTDRTPIGCREEDAQAPWAH